MMTFFFVLNFTLKSNSEKSILFNYLFFYKYFFMNQLQNELR